MTATGTRRKTKSPARRGKPRSSSAKSGRGRKSARPAAGRDAESLAGRQQEISVSEFFAKNRHLLGFDNPRKALLTTVKEAVDNALDACEEGGILPELFIGIEALSETRYVVTVRDNGPGIVRKQVENVFGKLLYGSKFHRLKMSRGQQGIGIAAAGMYGLMTTGKPMVIHTKPHPRKPSHRLTLAIDLKKNKADVSDEEERHDFPSSTGTEVVIVLEGRFQRGRQSVDEYLQQTAIANPHARIVYQPPDAGQHKEEDEKGRTRVRRKPASELFDDQQHALKLVTTASETTTTPGGIVVFPRTIEHLPEEPKEIKPHPRGVELGMLLRMLKDSEHRHLGGFLQNEFCRVSLRVANELCRKAGLTNRTWVKHVAHHDAEQLYAAIQETRFMAPSTDCLSPIGDAVIRAGMLKGVRAEFYTSVTRPPSVYRGNPFQIEVGLAFGGDLPAEESARVIRFANRVPMLYQQSACSAFKAVVETSWRNYGLSQPKGSLPVGPVIVMVHMASVWVPFTSESKEAVADYDEIRKEMKLALSECGRKLKTYINRRARVRRESERRNVFGKYIGEIATALAKIDPQLKPTDIKRNFEAVARRFTEEADLAFDDDGNPVRVARAASPKTQRVVEDDSVVIVDRAAPPPKPTSRRRRGKSEDLDEGLFD